jgi:hypothetical protein
VRLLGLPLLACGLVAAPQWKAPKELHFGRVETLLLVDEEPGAKPILRPQVDEKLGPLHVRSLEPTEDGRGWRFQVQAFEPGTAVLPALDLGDGRRAPELRLPVPRTTPHGAPWMGWGGGREDQLPLVPFPLLWAIIAASPLLLVVAGGWMLWRRAAPGRRRLHTRHVFQKAWPPKGGREGLDSAHAAGRALLAAYCGEEAMAWGAEDFQARGFDPWSQWARSLDAARFGRTTPPFPAADTLLSNLEARSHDIPGRRR